METSVFTSDVDAILAPFSPDEQCAGIGKHCSVREGIAGLKCEVPSCNHGNKVFAQAAANTAVMLFVF
jgi:hypothetical protein